MAASGTSALHILHGAAFLALYISCSCVFVLRGGVTGCAGGTSTSLPPFFSSSGQVLNPFHPRWAVSIRICVHVCSQCQGALTRVRFWCLNAAGPPILCRTAGFELWRGKLVSSLEALPLSQVPLGAGLQVRERRGRVK